MAKYDKKIILCYTKRMTGLIVARSINNVIGKNGVIPWKIEGEQKQFKELTTGNVVIMGRKTYEEIGRPLPNRKTIVISKSKTFEGENLSTEPSVKDAVILARKLYGNLNIFIAGGYEVYKEALPLVDVMYITEVRLVIEDGDVFFPDFDINDFEVKTGETSGDKIKYTRMIYTRRKK